MDPRMYGNSYGHANEGRYHKADENNAQRDNRHNAPGNVTPSVVSNDRPLSYAGEPYMCPDGSVLYVDATDSEVDMTLVYSDNTYGTSHLDRQKTDDNTRTYGDGVHVLTVVGDEASFAINDVAVAKACRQK